MDQTMLYVGFLAFVLLMLFLDLKVFHAEGHQDNMREAAIWVVVWIALGVVFGVILFYWQGPTKSAEYFAGYLIEKALSVDNVFLFIVIFSYFKVPPPYQHRILFFGILGAIVFRGAFIALGAALINRFEFVIYIFGALLLVTAVRIVRGVEDHEPENNPVLKLFRKMRTSHQLDGQKLFTVENGKRMATPLLVVLLMIETTDIIFAIDSIPAIFAITRDPFIVFTSNVFAILGLRALYFLLAGSMLKFHLLNYGLGLILAFVGVKMLLSHYIHVPTWLSLTLIVVTLTVTAGASIKFPRPEEPMKEESAATETHPDEA